MTTQDIYFCIQTGLQFLVGGGIDTVDAPAMIDRWQKYKSLVAALTPPHNPEESSRSRRPHNPHRRGQIHRPKAPPDSLWWGFRV